MTVGVIITMFVAVRSNQQFQ